MLCSALAWRAEIGFRQSIGFALTVCTVVNVPRARTAQYSVEEIKIHRLFSLKVTFQHVLILPK